MTKNYSADAVIHPMYRDHLFIAIFGKLDERSKRWRLDLYNALNDSTYSDSDALELNTLENVLFIKMHNDVSFLIDSQMTLYEHQSSPNPNMPLRGLLYFAQLYQKYISREKNNLISETLRKSLIRILLFSITARLFALSSMTYIFLMHLFVKINQVTLNGQLT